MKNETVERVLILKTILLRHGLLVHFFIFSFLSFTLEEAETVWDAKAEIRRTGLHPEL